MAPRRTPSVDDELRRVYRAHVRRVYAFFGHYVGRQAAEDLTSQTFERVTAAWKRFDSSRASEKTWILAIARNLLTDHYRREALRTSVSIDAQPQLLDSLVDDTHPIAGLLSSQAFAGWLSELGPDAREVLALRFGADLTTREIAAITGHSEVNVDQIVSRSIRRLRVRAEASGTVRDRSA